MAVVVTVNKQPYTAVEELYASTNGWLPVRNSYTRYYSSVYKSTKPTVRRVRPVIPELAPTEHVTGRITVFPGDLSYKTVTFPWCAGGLRYWNCGNLSWVPATGSWDTPPGSNTYTAELSGLYYVPRISIDSESLAANECLKHLNEKAISLSLTVAEASETAQWLGRRGMQIVGIIDALSKRSWPKFRLAVEAAWKNPPPHQAKFQRFKLPAGPYGYSHIGRVSAKMPKRAPKIWNKVDAKASDLWLESRYAVTPLLFEAEAYVLWLNGLWFDYVSMTKVYGKNERYYSGTFKIKPYTWPSACGGSPGVAPSGDMPWFASIVDKRVAYYRVKDYQKRMYSTLGLNASDIPAAVWERIPLSFVGDWGITFGDYLNLLKADIGLEYVTGYSSSTLFAMGTGENISAGGALGFGFKPPCFVTERYWRRIAGPPRPMVVVRSAFSWRRQLDAIALLHGLRKKIQHIN